jgi:hypothetical protein
MLFHYTCIPFRGAIFYLGNCDIGAYVATLNTFVAMTETDSTESSPMTRRFHFVVPTVNRTNFP